MPPRVTLLTDFGTRDGYVGALKAVISAAAPGVLIDDVAHDVSRGDVTSAAYALGRYWRLYPKGVVHLAVVDPGVGTPRRALACEADDRFLVAPDNGLLSRVLESASRWRLVELSGGVTPDSIRTGRSFTFHGRDVFAPAAAHLALGRALEELGGFLSDPFSIEEPSPSRETGSCRGVVVAVDRFGNLLTNLPGSWLVRGRGDAEVRGRRAHAATTYADVAPGDLVALVSSDGRVEIAVRDGSAAELLGAEPGTEVRLRAG
jgi:hypothetical protein